jgi:Tol biopolymer transport system component
VNFICTPDSKYVVYATAEGVWRMPIEGGTAVKLELPVALIMGFSPDGKLAFYTSSEVQQASLNTNLIVTTAAGGAPLHTFEVPSDIRMAQFTPDGKAIAFVLRRNQSTNIWEQPLAGGDLIQLTKFSFTDLFTFAWSRDGEELAFSRAQGKTDVVMMSGFR